MEVSAKTGSNIDNLFIKIIEEFEERNPDSETKAQS